MLSARQAGDLSTLFDVGGVAGGILAGHLSDKTGASALVAAGFTAACVPALWLYRAYGHVSLAANVGLMMAAGFLVNGPYALITTAVSADLGTHESLNGNAKVRLAAWDLGRGAGRRPAAGARQGVRETWLPCHTAPPGTAAAPQPAIPSLVSNAQQAPLPPLPPLLNPHRPWQR